MHEYDSFIVFMDVVCTLHARRAAGVLITNEAHDSMSLSLMGFEYGCTGALESSRSLHFFYLYFPHMFL